LTEEIEKLTQAIKMFLNFHLFLFPAIWVDRRDWEVDTGH